MGLNVARRVLMSLGARVWRALHGRDNVPILIDQEGGRVARMRPPVWPDFPAGGAFDALYDIAPITAIEAARCNAEAIALSLTEVGINVDCLPVLDVRVPNTHSAIGDRALGSDPLRVAALGRAILDGLALGGVIGVVKHMGHVVYDVWDNAHTATMSRFVIDEVIRDMVGFDGLLMSDDLDMNALQGDVASRALACVAAGCDLALNCWGRFDEMVAIANILPEITRAARARLDRAMTLPPVPFDADRLAHLLDKRDQLLALADTQAKLTGGATGAA